VTISDDGRGLDPDVLKKVAIKRGILSAEKAQALTPDETFALIYLPGFSTANGITDVSGRGVGMDAVITSVREKLGGSITIASEVGKGTSFTIQIPLSTS
jgi:two-component system, chemotaxis family, sensor kinase CheA